MNLKKTILLTSVPLVLLWVGVELFVHDSFAFVRRLWRMDRCLELVLSDPERVSSWMLDDIIRQHMAMKRAFQQPHFEAKLDFRIGEIYLKMARTDEAFEFFQAAIDKARASGLHEMEEAFLARAFYETRDHDFEKAQALFYEPLIGRFKTQRYGLQAPLIRLMALKRLSSQAPGREQAYLESTASHYQNIIDTVQERATQAEAQFYLATTYAVMDRHIDAASMMMKALETSEPLTHTDASWIEKRRGYLKRLISWMMMNPSLSQKVISWVDDYRRDHPEDPLCNDLETVKTAFSHLNKIDMSATTR